MPQPDKDFLEQQRIAMERMREMQALSQIKAEPHTMPPVPPFVRVSGGKADSRPPKETPARENPPEKKEFAAPKKNERQSRQINPFSSLGLTLGNNFKLDKDITLVLGLLLILANEKADRKLLLALLYILM